VRPREIRETLGLQPGQPVQAPRYQHRVECLPVPSVTSMRGLFEGIDTAVPRDADRERTSSSRLPGSRTVPTDRTPASRRA